MKYTVDYSSNFKKQYKKMARQGKDLNKLYAVVEMLSDGKTLDKKYKNHKLSDDARYKDCEECHIEPDWLLIYRIVNEELILLLLSTGSHSDLF